MIEPKPCPVCGSEKIITTFWQTEKGTVTYIACDHCDRTSPRSKPYADPDEADAEAIGLWNEAK